MYMKVAIITDIYHENRNNLVGIMQKPHDTYLYNVFSKCIHEGFLLIIKIL